MTDGSPAAGHGQRDDEEHGAAPAPAAAPTSGVLASARGTPAADHSGTEAEDTATSTTSEGSGDDDDEDDAEDGEDGDEEDEEEDEEPKLKYARLTPHLGAVYRNGDATSSFLVAGDKMIIGTHNGNIVSLGAHDSRSKHFR